MWPKLAILSRAIADARYLSVLDERLREGLVVAGLRQRRPPPGLVQDDQLEAGGRRLLHGRVDFVNLKRAKFFATFSYPHIAHTRHRQMLSIGMRVVKLHIYCKFSFLIFSVLSFGHLSKTCSRMSSSFQN